MRVMAGEIEVKIIQVTSGTKQVVLEQEKSLARLRNNGWVIVAAGGGTGRATADTIGFVVLERESTRAR